MAKCDHVPGMPSLYFYCQTFSSLSLLDVGLLLLTDNRVAHSNLGMSFYVEADAMIAGILFW